jgi:antitoxin component of RelBE/YafQ-DinJ toxin-antitoxin module
LVLDRILGMKQQLNIRIDEDLVQELKIEAVQMGIKLSSYIELLLQKRKELLK